DEWKPEYLQEITKLIVRFPDAGAYATLYEIQKTSSKMTANINVDLKKDESGLIDYFRGALYQPIISASSVTIPKVVFTELGGFSQKLNKGEDLEMWCKIGLKYDVAFKNTVLATYYMDAENRSDIVPREYKKSFMSKAEDILNNNYLKKKNSEYFREYMIKIIISKARHLIDINQNKEARR